MVNITKETLETNDIEAIVDSVNALWLNERHTPHIERHTPHIERHTPHIERHTPHIERHTPHIDIMAK